MASVAVRSKTVVLLLFIYHLLLGLVLGICFVLKYAVSFVALQSPRRGRESWLLYFCCVLIAMSL